MKNWNDTPFASLVYQDTLTDTERLLLSVICERIDETIQNLRHEHSSEQLTGIDTIDGKAVSDALEEIDVKTPDLGISLNGINAESTMSDFANITVFRRLSVGGGNSIKAQWIKVFTECSCPMDKATVTHLYFKVNPDIIGLLLKDTA